MSRIETLSHLHNMHYRLQSSQNWYPHFHTNRKGQRSGELFSSIKSTVRGDKYRHCSAGNQIILNRQRSNELYYIYILSIFSLRNKIGPFGNMHTTTTLFLNDFYITEEILLIANLSHVLLPGRILKSKSRFDKKIYFNRYFISDILSVYKFSWLAIWNIDNSIIDFDFI